MQRSLSFVSFCWIVIFASFQLCVQAFPFYVMFVYEVNAADSSQDIMVIKQDIAQKLGLTIDQISIAPQTPKIFHEKYP